MLNESYRCKKGKISRANVDNIYNKHLNEFFIKEEVFFIDYIGWKLIVVPENKQTK